MSDLNEKVKFFRSSAGFYLSNRKLAEEYTSEKANLYDDRLYSYIRGDLRFVEDTFKTIKNRCGTAARVVIYLLYVEKWTQQSVAEMFDISRRQLQYSLKKWLETIFDTGDTKIQKSDAFKESCRMYEKEKELISGIFAENKILSEYLKEDIEFTESVMFLIKNEWGNTASHIVYMLFGRKQQQAEAAFEMGISRRKLQYLLNQWFSNVL